MEILEEIQKYYQSLYTAEVTNLDDQNWLLEQLGRPLTHDREKLCDGPVTPHELKLALTNMANNKSPGPDGIIIEFYKIFWPLLSENLTAIFNNTFDMCSMTTSQQQATIKLLYKKDDKKLLKN